MIKCTLRLRVLREVLKHTLQAVSFVFMIAVLNAANMLVAAEVVTEISWNDLRQLNLETGNLPEDIKNKIKNRVKISGYAVSLELTKNEVTQILFVPIPGACRHKPPPPPNLIIDTMLKEAYFVEEMDGSLWLEGNLSVTPASTYNDLMSGKPIPTSWKLTDGVVKSIN